MTSKVRINRYDNLKGMAIFLVVLGHLDAIKHLDSSISHLIFMIDLPVLFFVSGYFSKTGPGEMSKSVRRLLIPYMLFCLITAIFNWLVLGKYDFNWIFIKSGFALWFLIALFLMKAALPLVEKFRYPIALAVVCSLLMGLVNIPYSILGITRAVGYFPIFLVGFYYRKSRDNKTDRYSKFISILDKHYIILAVIVAVLTVIICVKFKTVHFMFKRPYSGNLIFEMIKRFIVISLQMGIVLCCDKLMTNRRCILTKVGKNSMAVYLLHCYVILSLPLIFTKSITANMPVYLAISLAIAVITTYILSRDFVSRYLNIFTDGVCDLIFGCYRKVRQIL